MVSITGTLFGATQKVLTPFKNLHFYRDNFKTVYKNIEMLMLMS